MKPAAFAYHRVQYLDEAVSLLEELGDGAKVIAGGQSLVPMMNFRLARPSALVDIWRVGGLRYVRRDPSGALRIGALARHCDLEPSAGAPLDDGYRVLRETVGLVGHHVIRARGTFGGSIAHADPAAEWCVLALALDGRVTTQGLAGSRELPVDGFFAGFMQTALEPAEIITEVSFARPRSRAAFEEFARRRGDFAVASVAVAFDVEDDRCVDPRIVVGGVDAVPRRLEAAERLLAGQALDGDCIAAAARTGGDEISPGADIHGSEDYRRRLTAGLIRRALQRANANGEGNGS